MNEGKHLATWRDRYVAKHYFLILANTGMRVGELRTLRWSDFRPVENGPDWWAVAHVRGKTGAREVVFQKGLTSPHRRWLALEAVAALAPR